MEQKQTGLSTMNEAEFNQMVDDLMFDIEETIDDSGVDIDYENSGGMLTLTCDLNGSQIILSRQPSMAEIWLAAQSGGFHFKLKGDNGEIKWRNTVSDELLSAMLTDACQAQSSESIQFDF
ncbi:MAG: CyaY protein [Porticoccaceae bacterium]